MNNICSKLDELTIGRIADEKFDEVAKYIAPMLNTMLNIAVTEFTNEIEPILNKAILLDPQCEEEMSKTVRYIMGNSIKMTLGKAFDKILREDEDNA